MPDSSDRDWLTGLPGLKYFYSQLQTQVEKVRERDYSLGLLMLDVDYMREVNDFCGIPAGNAALKCIALTLRNMVRGEDIVARCGADEFGIILPVCNSSALNEFKERLKSAVSSFPFVHDYGEGGGKVGAYLTVSVGTAIFPDEAESDLALMHRVMSSLLHDKTLRNRQDVKFRVYP